MREIGWLLLFTPLLRHRARVLSARVADVAAVVALANLMAAEWAVRRLGGEGDRDE